MGMGDPSSASCMHSPFDGTSNASASYLKLESSLKFRAEGMAGRCSVKTRSRKIIGSLTHLSSELPSATHVVSRAPWAQATRANVKRALCHRLGNVFTAKVTRGQEVEIVDNTGLG